MIEIELKRIADALEKIAALTPLKPAVEPKPEVGTVEPVVGTPVAPPATEPKRGRGRPPKTETPAPAPAPTPPPPASEPDDDWGETEKPTEQPKLTKDDVLKAMLAYKARLVEAKVKGGMEKKQAEAESHKETGQLLKSAAGCATLGELPEAKYADVVKAASA